MIYLITVLGECYYFQDDTAFVEYLVNEREEFNRSTISIDYIYLMKCFDSHRIDHLTNNNTKNTIDAARSSDLLQNHCRL
jgi:hypothetical protein